MSTMHHQPLVQTGYRMHRKQGRRKYERAMYVIETRVALRRKIAELNALVSENLRAAESKVFS